MNDLRERVARAIKERVERDGFATHEEVADTAITAMTVDHPKGYSSETNLRERVARSLCRKSLQDFTHTIRAKFDAAWIDNRVETRWPEFVDAADVAIAEMTLDQTDGHSAAIAAGVGVVPADLRWSSTTAINGNWIAKPVLDHNGDPTESWFVTGGAMVSVLVASGMDEDDAQFIAASANLVRALIDATPPAPPETGEANK
jgi:hypothetical protein